MITKCEITNFKSFDEKIIELNPFSIIVGPNNIGKSSILHAMLLGHEVIKKGINFNSRTDQYELKNTTLTFDDINIIPLSTVDSIWLNNKFTQTNAVKIKFYYNEDSWIEVSLTRGKNKNVYVGFSKHNVDNVLLEQLQDTSRPYAVLVPGLAGIPAKEAYVGRFSRTKSITVGEANLVLRNVVASLGMNETKKEDFERLQRILRKLFPELSSLRVEYDERIHEHLIVEYSRNGSKEFFDIVTAGTGFLQTLQILSYIFEYGPKLLLLDEPDSHLHANNQVILLHELLALSRELNFQIIISTHSKDILKNTPPTSIVWVNSEKVVSPGVDDGIMVQAYIDLGGLDNLDKLRLKPHSVVLLIEDEDTTIWKKIFEKSFGDEWESFVLVTSFKGKNNKVALYLTSDFYKKHFATRKIGFVIDRDFDSDEKISEYAEEADRHQIKPFILQVHEIENHLVNPLVLIKAFNKCEITVDELEIEELLATAIEETLNDNKYKLMDKLQLENKRLTASAAEQKALEIIQEHKSDVKNGVGWFRGKPLLKKVRSLVKTRYGKTLTDGILTDSLFEAGIPEIQEIIDWIKSSHLR